MVTIIQLKELMIMKRLIRIKYDNQEYQCSIIDWIKIKRIMCKLFCIRQIRRLKLLLSKDKISVYGIIILMWAIYLMVVYGVYSIRNTNISIMDLLSQSRDNIFITIIIAFIVDILNHIKEYSANLKRQRNLFMDALNDFDEPLRLRMNNYAREYYQMYNLTCYKMTERYIKENTAEFNAIDIGTSLEAINDRIHIIERELKDGKLIIQKEEMLNLYLDDAKKRIKSYKQKQSEEEYWKLMLSLYEIQDRLKSIWRLDKKYDNEIVRLLYKNNREEIEGDFTLRMKLDNFSFEMIKTHIIFKNDGLI